MILYLFSECLPFPPACPVPICLFDIYFLLLSFHTHSLLFFLPSFLSSFPYIEMSCFLILLPFCAVFTYYCLEYRQMMRRPEDFSFSSPAFLFSFPRLFFWWVLCLPRCHDIFITAFRGDRGVRSIFEHYERWVMLEGRRESWPTQSKQAWRCSSSPCSSHPARDEGVERGEEAHCLVFLPASCARVQCVCVRENAACLMPMPFSPATPRFIRYVSLFLP